MPKTGKKQSKLKRLSDKLSREKSKLVCVSLDRKDELGVFLPRNGRSIAELVDLTLQDCEETFLECALDAMNDQLSKSSIREAQVVYEYLRAIKRLAKA